MATTTNFGWNTPDDTDAVTNGALAIRTLGSAVDSTMNAAVGGTMRAPFARKFYPTDAVVGTAVARSDTANSVLLVPFLPAYDMTLTQMAVYVSTAATASCYFGIYSDASNKPGTLIADFGAISTSTTGIKQITISQAVSAGTRYWLAVKPNSTSTRFYGGVYNRAAFAAFNDVSLLTNSGEVMGVEAVNSSSGALGALSSLASDFDAGVLIELEA